MSYKALLNAKACTDMYNNFGNNITMSGDMAGYSRDDDDHENGDMEHEESIHSDDQEDYQNGEGTTPEHQGSEDGQAMQEGFSNFSLKRCRFSPRQDIALMKEIFAADDKPYEHVGKAAWESWGKIAHVLNQKQIFGPILTLSALTCKLRFEFLMKNFGGNALKFNPKRGTIEEFQKRDELIAMVAPMVPHGDEMGNGHRKRRGRPRKPREHYSPAEMEEEPIGESSFVGHSMLDSPYASNKRKPGRPKKVVSSDGFMDGATLNDYLRPRLSVKSESQNPPAVSVPVASGASVNSSPQRGPPSIPVMRYLQHAAGASDATMVHLLVEYLKQHHESDLQFRREDLESRQRERSEERRLEREQLEVKKAEIALQQEKWEIEKRERELNLELMKKKLLKQ